MQCSVFDCFLVECRFCGELVISSAVWFCPFCGSGFLRCLPVTGDVRETFEYFCTHGFFYLSERNEVVL